MGLSEADWRLKVTAIQRKYLKRNEQNVFSYAKQQGYFDGENPARNTAIPPSRPSEETYAYSLEEIAQILSVLPEPAATVFAVAAFTERGAVKFAVFCGKTIVTTKSK